MTRKEWAIAGNVDQAFQQFAGTFPRELHQAVAEAIANGLTVDNKKFDRKRFLVACGAEVV